MSPSNWLRHQPAALLGRCWWNSRNIPTCSAGAFKSQMHLNRLAAHGATPGHHPAETSRIGGMLHQLIYPLERQQLRPRSGVALMTAALAPTTFERLLA
jgi:hypothetical protein